MLKHPTIDQLHALGLHGMAKAFTEIDAAGEADGLGHHEWLGLLLDREASWRQDKRLAARLRVAKLRQQACVEDVDYRSPRGLDRALFQKLAEGEWINAHDNLALVGPTGVGKSWLASALGHKACRDNRSVLYQRVPRLFEDLALARGDGRHSRLLRNLGRADLLILDDWGLEPLDAAARHDLLEILEERYGHRSTMITSQIPVDRWHEIIGDPTYADAILDRLVHNAHRIDLAGESMRRTRGKQTRVDQPPLPMPENQRAGRTASPGRFEIGRVSDLKSESRARSDRNRGSARCRRGHSRADRQSHIPRDRHHRLPCQWWRAGAAQEMAAHESPRTKERH